MACLGFQPGTSRQPALSLMNPTHLIPLRVLWTGLCRMSCPSTLHEYIKGREDSPLRPKVTGGNRVLLNLTLCICLPFLSLLSSHFSSLSSAPPHSSLSFRFSFPSHKTERLVSQYRLVISLRLRPFSCRGNCPEAVLCYRHKYSHFIDRDS